MQFVWNDCSLLLYVHPLDESSLSHFYCISYVSWTSPWKCFSIDIQYCKQEYRTYSQALRDICRNERGCKIYIYIYMYLSLTLLTGTILRIQSQPRCNANPLYWKQGKGREKIKLFWFVILLTSYLNTYRLIERDDYNISTF